MVYQRGKRGIWWYRFRFGGRIVHESAKTASKTLARDAERQRRRDRPLTAPSRPLLCTTPSRKTIRKNICRSKS